MPLPEFTGVRILGDPNSSIGITKGFDLPKVCVAISWEQIWLMIQQVQKTPKHQNVNSKSDPHTDPNPIEFVYVCGYRFYKVGIQIPCTLHS